MTLYFISLHSSSKRKNALGISTTLFYPSSDFTWITIFSSLKNDTKLIKMDNIFEINAIKLVENTNKYSSSSSSSPSCAASADFPDSFSCYSSLSSIASGRSSRQHPVPVQSCFRYILAGHPTPARPCEGVHRSTLLMSSSLLLQQCPTCLVRPI